MNARKVLNGIDVSSWHWSIQCHSSCQEKMVLGVANDCLILPDETTKNPQ